MDPSIEKAPRRIRKTLFIVTGLFVILMGVLVLLHVTLARRQSSLWEAFQSLETQEAEIGATFRQSMQDQMLRPPGDRSEFNARMRALDVQRQQNNSEQVVVLDSIFSTRRRLLAIKIGEACVPGVWVTTLVAFFFLCRRRQSR